MESPPKRPKPDDGFSDSDEEEPGQTEPLKVDFLDFGAAKIGACELPGGKSRNGVRRSLNRDLQILKELGIKHTFVLNTDGELKRVRVKGLFDAYESMGFQVHRYPIIDGTIPSSEQLEAILGEMHSLVMSGHDCAIHCLGGLGRTGVILAAYLLRYEAEKWTPETAIEKIRELRGKGAIQTVKQYNLLFSFK